MTSPAPGDAPHRRILVASPIEPSGASWLLNCFLELGIRIDHKPVVDRVWRGSGPSPDAARMWIKAGDGRTALHPKAGVLMKFLPALVRRPEFSFRDDVSVGYVQDFPSRQLGEAPPGDRPCVLMVRDPRDAFHSSYRRSTPAMDFAEYLDFPHPQTLLRRSAHWALFVAAWLALPACHVVRFEDYKRDAEATLRSVLAALDLAFSDRVIEDAVRLSSFESARDAERAVRDRFPSDRQLANRSGTVGEGRNNAEIHASMPMIESEAASVLRDLGYMAHAPEAGDPFAAARLRAAFLAFFNSVHLPEAVASGTLNVAASQDDLLALLSVAQRVDADLLAKAALPPAEARALLDSLTEFTRNHAEWLAGRLALARSVFQDGSGYFFQRIREMRQSVPSNR